MTHPSTIICRYKNEYRLNPESLCLRAVTLTGETVRLRPLQARRELICLEDVTLLTQWRNQHRQYFLTNFTATTERTLHWITEVMGPDLSRILFMLDDARGTTFGHAGLCHIDMEQSSCELDNVIRGIVSAKGGMHVAVESLCFWVRETLGLRKIWLRVLRDNPAVAFYARLGFKWVKDVPLRRQVEDVDFVRWIEISQSSGPAAIEPSAERFLTYMELPL